LTTEHGLATVVSSQIWQQGGVVFLRLAVVLLSALVLPVSAAQAWTWPVDGPVLRPFSFDHAHPYAAGQHRGVDLGAPRGTNVLAPAKGVVTFAGTVPTGGKTVSIETSSGHTATLVHLGSIGVKSGTLVTEGAVVGTVGPSGVVDSAEPFVYFGVRVTSDDQGYVDPLGLLPVRPAASPRTQPEAAVEAPAAPAPMPVAEAPAAVPAVASPDLRRQNLQESEAAASQPTVRDAPVAEPVAERAAKPLPLETVSPVTPVLAKEFPHARSLAPSVTRPVSQQHSSVASLRPERARRVSASHTARVLVHQHARARGEIGGSESARSVRATGGALRNGWLVALAALAIVLSAALLIARAGRRRPARIMSSVESEPSFVQARAKAQDLGGASLAVCVGEASPGPRSRVRRAGGHLRALPPPEGQRRLDGERHGRARDARDGHGRSRGRLAA